MRGRLRLPWLRHPAAGQLVHTCKVARVHARVHAVAKCGSRFEPLGPDADTTVGAHAPGCVVSLLRLPWLRHPAAGQLVHTCKVARVHARVHAVAKCGSLFEPLGPDADTTVGAHAPGCVVSLLRLPWLRHPAAGQLVHTCKVARVHAVAKCGSLFEPLGPDADALRQDAAGTARLLAVSHDSLPFWQISAATAWIAWFHLGRILIFGK